MFYSLLETNDEQSTVDMSLRDLAEAGNIGFPYLFFLYVFSAKCFLNVKKEAAWPSGLGRQSGGPGFKASTLPLAGFVSR